MIVSGELSAVPQAGTCLTASHGPDLDSGGKIAAYRLAREHSRAVRSLLESWAHTDTVVDCGPIDPRAGEYEHVRGIQHQIVALLITMIRRLEADLDDGEDAA